MAFTEPAKVPLNQVELEPMDSGEDSEAVSGRNEGEEEKDMAVPESASMLAVRLEEKQPSDLKLFIEATTLSAAFTEPARVPFNPVKLEPVDDSGEDSESVCGRNENGEEKDIALREPALLPLVQLEEEEPSDLQLSIEPVPCPAAFTEPAKVPFNQVELEPVDHNGECSETECGSNEDDDDMAVPDPASMLSVRLEEEEPSHLKISIEPAPPPAVLDKDCRKEVEHPLSQFSVDAVDLPPTSAVTETQKPALFLCDKCPNAFKVETEFLTHVESHKTAHIRIHTGERPYSCLVCGQAFNQRHTLTRHVREHASRDTAKAFSCLQCSKTFPRQVNLDIHMRTHTGERPFKCELCGKRFSQSGHLARHKLTHTGKTPFPCPICGKGFSQKKRLVDHARTHTGERPFRCHYCPKTFTHAEYLKSHLHTHREEKYVCPICRQMFSRKYKLMEHMRTHSGEYPFRCAHCRFCFISKKDIAYHIHSQHLSDIMGEGATSVEESHMSSLGNMEADFCESESPPYCTVEKEKAEVKLGGTSTAGFALPSDEEELHKSDVLSINSDTGVRDTVVRIHNSPEHTSAISETVSCFIKEELNSDMEDSACSTSDRESSDFLPQLFHNSVPKMEPTVIIKEELDTLVEDPLCLRSDVVANTSDTSLVTHASSEITLAATTKEDAVFGFDKNQYLEGVVSDTVSKEEQLACVKAEVISANEYLRFLPNEGMQESLVSGSVKASDSSDENFFISPEHTLCLKSENASNDSKETLLSDVSCKSPVPFNVKEEPISSEEYPLCLKNDAVCKTLPTPLIPDIRRKMYSVTNFSESTAAEMQCPLYLGKDIVHKTLQPASISGSNFAKSTPGVWEPSVSDVEGPLCLKSGVGSENIAPNIFSEISCGTKQNTTIRNSVSELPLCLKRDVVSKRLAPSFVGNINDDAGPSAYTEHSVTSLSDSSHFENGMTCKAVPAHFTFNTSQKIKQSAIIKEDRLKTLESPLCLKRNVATDDLPPPPHLAGFGSTPKPNIRIRKDLVHSSESPLCLKSDTRCQSLQEPSVSDISKITARFPLPAGTTLTVSAPGGKQFCNMSNTLVSYQQMLYDKLVSDFRWYSENNAAVSLESNEVSRRPGDFVNCSVETLNPANLKRTETCIEWNLVSGTEKLDEAKYVNAINSESVIVHSSFVGKALQNEPSSEKFLMRDDDSSSPYKQQHVTALHSFSTVKQLTPIFQCTSNVVSTGSKVADNLYMH